MDYTPEIYNYVIDILMDRKYPINVINHISYLECILIINYKERDFIIFKINRDPNKKSYFRFKNNLPYGNFKINKEIRYNLLKNII